MDITRSRFSIDGPTFLTKLGGLIGVGRTLLWILVSLLGTAQVVKFSHTTLREAFPHFHEIFLGGEETEGLGVVEQMLLSDNEAGQQCST